MRHLVVGFYDYNNVGDNFLHSTTKRHLAEVDPGAEFVALPWSDMISQRYDLMREELSPDVVVSGGGGWFGEEGLQQGFIYSVFPDAKALGCFNVAYGVGVNVIYRDWSQTYIKRVFDSMDFVVVRDEVSRYHLMMAGCESAMVGSDIVMDHPFERTREARRDTVGFITTWEYFIPYYLDAIRFFLLNGYRVVLIPFGSVSDDYVIHDRLIRMADSERVGTVKRIHDMQHQIAYLLDAVSKCGILVTHRLHGMAAAILTGTPFVALNYHFKMREMERQAGLERYSVPMVDISSELYFNEWEKNPGDMTHLKRVAAMIHADYDRALGDVDRAAGILRGRVNEGKEALGNALAALRASKGG